MAEDDHRGRGFELAAFGLGDEGGDETSGLLARLARAHSALERERAEAPALVAELLAVPEACRRERLAADPRFQSWGLAERLLQQAFDGGEREAEESGRLAALALAAAEHLDSGRHAPPVVADFQARAWACLGTARLLLGDPPGADQALSAAAGCLAQGTGDLLVEGNLLEFEAAVRLDQGRPGEAAALLKQAASRYREIGEAELLTRAEQKRAQVLPGGRPSGSIKIDFPSNTAGKG